MRRRPLMSAVFLIAGISAVYLGMCAFLYIKQDDYIYFPERKITATPLTFGIPYEDLHVPASDGISVNCWLIRAGDPTGAVVFAHGNGGNLGDRVEKYLLLRDLGLTVFAFDYRGYGNSGGSPSEEGFYLDAEAVVSEAGRRGFGGGNLILYGESIGGAVAAKVAAKSGAAGLIIESSFTSAAEMAKHYYPAFPVKLIMRSEFDTLRSMRSCACPVLVMHSPGDDIIPYRMGLHLYESAPGPKRFARLEGGHNGGGILVSAEAREDLRSFVKDLMKGRE